MKKFFLAILCAYGIISKADISPDATKMAEVAAGTRHTAYASWYGYSSTDATTNLQNALNCIADTVIIDNVGIWFVQPLTITNSNLVVVFENGTIVQGRAGYFTGTYDRLLTITAVHGIKILGYGGTMRMNASGNEDRHAIRIDACDTVGIYGLRIVKASGDGIYVCGYAGNNYSSYITLQECKVDSSYRNGISIISVKHLVVDGCIVSHTSGTAPQDGIDLEPNYPTEFMQDVTISNCEFFDNRFGIDVSLWNFTQSTATVSITVRHCMTHDNRYGYGYGSVLFWGPEGVSGIGSINFVGNSFDTPFYYYPNPYTPLTVTTTSTGSGHHYVRSAFNGYHSGWASDSSTGWSWAYACANASPGDTLRLPDSYNSGLKYFTDGGPDSNRLPSGTAGNYIVVTAWPIHRHVQCYTNVQFDANGDGPWNTINMFDASYVSVENLDIVNESLPAPGTNHVWDIALVRTGDHTRLINCVLRNATGLAVADQSQMSNSVVYGNVIYFPGRNNMRSGGGYALYLQNNPGNGTKKIEENIYHNAYYLGAQMYSESADITNILFRGNVAFNNGTPHTQNKFMYNLVMGPTNTNYKLTADTVLNFYSYYDSLPPTNQIVAIGYNGAPATYIRFDSSIAVFNSSGTGGGMLYNVGTGFGHVGNVIVGQHSATYSNNRYILSRGFGLDTVIIRKNAYDSKRANIIIYNLDGSSTVTISSAILSQVLSNGETYELKSSTNYYGTPLRSGTWTSGTSLTVRMDSITIETPFQTGMESYGFNPVKSGAPYFAALVLLGDPEGGPSTPLTTTPTVTTTSISSITTTTASGGGNVTSDGGASVTARGVCWNTSANPTVSNNLTVDGTGTGSFTSSLTGLSAGITYYVRAYATNVNGTSYGSQVSFTTTSGTSAFPVVGELNWTGQPSISYFVNLGFKGRPTAWECCGMIGQEVYEDNISSGGVPIQSNIEHWADNAYAYDNGAYPLYSHMFWLDIEANYEALYHSSVGGPSTWAQVHSRAHEFALGTNWAKAKQPTIKFGYYWFPPLEYYGAIGSASDLKTWQTANDSLYELTASVDFFSPDFYPCDDFVDSVVSGVNYEWENMVRHIIAECRRLAPTKPIIPHMSAAWKCPKGSYVDSTQMYHMLQFVKDEGADAAFIWMGYEMTGGEPYGDWATVSTSGWYKAIVAFIAANLTGNTTPTVATTAISSITTTTASSGGNVTADGGLTVTARGVCWNTSANPTVLNSHTTDGSGTGSFTSSITGLTTGVTYYVRAYAVNANGTSYGSQTSFTTLAVPTLTTTAASNISTTTATSGGNVSSAGGVTVTARGVCWNTSANPTTSNSHTSDGTGTGSFTSSITGLSAGTLYYVRAYATNSVGTAYGAQITFSSLTTPTVSTSSVSSIGATAAVGGGNVTSDGNTTVTVRGVCWNTTGTPTVSSDHTSDGTGTGSFTSYISNLAPVTTYYVRAYATNSVGTTYGTQISFNTISTTPTVSTTTVSNVTSSSATSGGNVISNGGATVTARGVCWNTTGTPIATGNHTSDGTGNGSFTSAITGLAGSTIYYVRAYASNSNGTSYGTQVSFTTSSVAGTPTVITISISGVTTTTAVAEAEVTSDGGSSIITRGVCWNTAGNPTILDSYSSSGTSTGSFTIPITGLLPSTTYYVRAFATNGAGTSYGTQISFATGAPSESNRKMLIKR
jgi:hypothetical protein